MTKRAVVFTGLIRNEAKFLEFLRLYEKESPEGRPLLYFSTWMGELEKYPKVADILNRLGAVILRQRQPDLVLPGHILHQIVALDFPLNIIDPDVFIYKSRPDFAEYSTYQAFMAQEPIPTSSEKFGNVTPRYKFHVVGFFAAHPFYINDITYCGLACDFSKITNLPFTALTRYNRVAPEQLIWGGGIFNQVRILDRYFRSNTGLIFDDEPKSMAHVDILKNSICYAYALAAYFMILDTSFSMLQEPPAATSDLVVNLSLEDFLWGTVNNAFIAFHPTAFTNSVKSLNAVSRILAGHFKPSPFGDMFLEALSILQLQKDPENYMSAEIESSALAYEDAVKGLNIGGGKAIRRNADGFVLEGARPKWIQEQTGTPLTQTLEAEVNYLRRVNNELQDKLRKTVS